MSNILIDLTHPGDLHVFRRAAHYWMLQGHNVLFSALDRETNIELLNYYELPYRVVYKRRRGKIALAGELLLRPFPTYAIARRFKTDLFVSMGNPTVGLPAWLMQKPYIALTDTEPAIEQHMLFKPFATVIATPTVFTREMGPKQVRYNSYHELAYLHPEEFTPDPRELESLGLTPNDTFFVVRFVAWGASHDIGEHGMTTDEKRVLIRELANRGRVFLSVENGKIDQEFETLVTIFPPEKVHHLLAFATMYVGEGATMASEAAVLGTPTVYANTFALGYIQELENKYGLLYWCPEGIEAIAKVRELLSTPDLKSSWQLRRSHLLEDKINTTRWLVDLGNSLLEDPHCVPEVAES